VPEQSLLFEKEIKNVSQDKAWLRRKLIPSVVKTPNTIAEDQIDPVIRFVMLP